MVSPHSIELLKQFAANFEGFSEDVVATLDFKGMTYLRPWQYTSNVRRMLIEVGIGIHQTGILILMLV